MKKLKLQEKKQIMPVIASCFLSLIFVACKTSYFIENNDAIVPNTDTSKVSSTTDVVTHEIKEVPVIYTSIPELSSRSDFILIGKIISAGEIINTARDVSDPTKTDSDYFDIGQIYEIKVERYLKGKGDKSINIVQHQGFLIAGSKTPSTTEIQEAKEEADYSLLKVNQRMLMFLNKSRYEYGEYKKGTLFVGGWHPWLFDITDPECVQSIDTIEDIYTYFPPQPLTEFVKQIYEPFDSASQIGTIPYPPPGTANRCPNKSSEPYP